MARNIICSFNEAEYRAMRRLVADAILATPSGDTRNLLTVINIKLMRDAEASGFQQLVDDVDAFTSGRDAYDRTGT